LGLAIVGPPVLAAVLVQFRNDLGLPSVFLLFLLLVVATSAVGGFWPAVVGALAASVLVNWYFVPPLHTLTIDEPENVLAVGVFLVIAIVVSTLVSLGARRAAEGARARAEAEVLARLVGAPPVSSVLESLRRVLALDGAAVLHRSESGWLIEAAS